MAEGGVYELTFVFFWQSETPQAVLVRLNDEPVLTAIGESQ
jgi:hypothetical protein